MVKLDDYLDPSEKIIWRGKPYKKAYILRACGALPFALVFFFLLMLFTGMDLIGLPLGILVLVIMLTIQPLGAFRLYPNVEYMITNERLLKSDDHRKVWFEKLEKTKKGFVKKGYTDKILGTGTIYPITEEYPYFTTKEYPINLIAEGGRYGSDRIETWIKIYNHFWEEYEKVTKIELKINTRNRPKLGLINDPYKIQKILEEAILKAPNYVNCEYCSYRYDLEKEGKCPKCGRKINSTSTNP